MSDRTRVEPRQRFAGDEHHLNLMQVFAALENEANAETNDETSAVETNAVETNAHAPQSGHRQITIFHRAPVTMVAFSFSDGGVLSDHSASGLVTIQAVATADEGVLEVRTASQTYALQSGEIVVLDPNVVHSVSSRGASRMLLTVHLQKETHV